MDKQAIGLKLKAAREKLGLSIPTVVERTRVKRSYIEAMETGDVEAFDHPVLARNFIRTYARFLKIAESEILPMLTEIAPPEHLKTPAGPAKASVTPAAESDAATPADADGPRPGKSWLVNFLLVFAALILVAGFYFMFPPASQTPTETAEMPVPAPIEDTPVTGAENDTGADTAGATAEAMSEMPKEHRAEMRAMADVWLNCENESRRFERILRAGEKTVVTFEKRLHLRVGNGPALSLSIDGKEIPTAGERKVFDKHFRVQEDGRVTAESPAAGSTRRTP